MLSPNPEAPPLQRKQTARARASKNGKKEPLGFDVLTSEKDGKKNLRMEFSLFRTPIAPLLLQPNWPRHEAFESRRSGHS